MNRFRSILLFSAFAGLVAAPGTFAAENAAPAPPVDGKFPPPQAPAGKWEALLSGNLEDHWTGMSLSIKSPLLSTTPNPDRPGEFILHIARGPTGLIRTLKPNENFILEFEWRHLTEAPSANGGPGTSGNSGLIIHHGPFPKPGGPYPNDGHEVQVCNLGNGSWYTSHGDTFTMPGSTSQAIPDPRFGISHDCGHRSMPLAFHGSKTGEWNRIRVTSMDGVIQHEVNGHLASSLYRATPRKGYLSLESEGAPVEFRGMRLQELAPDPDLQPKHVASLLPEEMHCDYLTERKPVELPAGNFMAVVDVKTALSPGALFAGLGIAEAPPAAGRFVLTVQNGSLSLTINGKEAGRPQAVAPEARGVLHLEVGSFGHAMVLRPVKK